MDRKNKKGIQMNQAFGAVLTVVLVAVLVILGVFMFDSLGTAVGSTNSTTIINETVNPTTAGTSVAQANACNFNNFAVSTIINRSGTVIPATNYTVGSAGTIANRTGPFGNDNWNATYSYTNGGGACVAADNTIVQFLNYPALVGLVGTIVFLGLVIGVLIASFVFGGKNKA